MLRWLHFLPAFFLAGWTLSCPAETVRPAKLLGAWWLEGSAGLDISGLSFCNGQLLAISDKRDDRVYRVRLPDSEEVRVASLDLFREFPAPEAPDGGGLVNRLAALVRPDAQMDFEGITCDGSTPYLVSERHERIARLSGEGDRAEAEWLPLRWREMAVQQGYLTIFNAGSEGIVFSGSPAAPVFWVALERKPRGLLRIAMASEDGTGAKEVQLLQLPLVSGLDFRGRPEDLTGLDVFEGGLYTLERNAFAVCRRSLESLEAQWCIDYGDVEEAPQFVYADTHFGKGEGLAVNERGIFVVLDNNNVARAADPSDQRALLMHLAHPDRP